MRRSTKTGLAIGGGVVAIGLLFALWPGEAEAGELPDVDDDDDDSAESKDGEFGAKVVVVIPPWRPSRSRFSVR